MQIRHQLILIDFAKTSPKFQSGVLRMKLLNQMLSGIIKIGTLEIEDASGTIHVHAGSPSPFIRVKLHDPALYKMLYLKPEMAAGEAYMDGTLTMEKGTLKDFITLFGLNQGTPLSPSAGLIASFLANKIKSTIQENTPLLSKQNVQHHYDISNELYGLFLDEGLNYSCAYFRTPEDTLEVAQENKLRHIASKMNIKPGHKILDIGCGWGSMSIYLAQNFDVDVLGVTLSVEQLKLAEQRVAKLGLGHKVRFALRDYREVQGEFHRIVSVGMLEHVGVKSLPEYFFNVKRLLTDDGVAMIHSICRTDGPGTAAPWLKKYIFPGGYSPALSEAVAAIEKTKLWITDTEIWRLHYMYTIAEWSKRFAENRARAAEMMGEHFCRMWEFYLVTSEVSFLHFHHVNLQIQLSKSLETLPLQRDYMFEMENQLLKK
jgi:cyclopropane-fatty-acyl-phospholipid synthase